MPNKKSSRSLKVKKVNSLQWIFEGFESRSDFIQKRMFGCEGAYLDDRLVLVLADSQEPWNGLLIPTERKFHKSIQAEFPQLQSHPVLGKWLYLPQNSIEFEEIVDKVIKLIQSKDFRFGVNPKQKKLNR